MFHVLQQPQFSVRALGVDDGLERPGQLLDRDLQVRLCVIRRAVDKEHAVNKTDHKIDIFGPGLNQKRPPESLNDNLKYILSFSLSIHDLCHRQVQTLPYCKSI